MKNSNPKASSLSYGQQALWYLNQMEPNSTAYHLGVCLELSGPLNERALVSAWMDIGMAHPQLRARFIISDEAPSMAIDSTPSSLRVEEDGGGTLHQFWKEIAERPFALDREAPVRALLLRGVNGTSHLLLCAHHLVADLWSSATILRALSAGYSRHISGQLASVFAREKMERREFAAEERQWLEGPEGHAAWNFWRKYFDGMKLEPILSQRIASGKGGEVPITLGGSEAKLVRAAALQKSTTPYAVLLACYARLLGEENDRAELCIGTPATIRSHAALRDAVGYYVNAVPVRCPIGKRGGDSVGVVAANAHAALKHRRFPFSVLVERLGIPRVPDTTPIFQSMFAYQSLPRTDRHLLPLALGTGGAQWEFGGDILAKTVTMPPFDAQFPITLALGPGGEGFCGNLQYDGRRVTAVNAVRIAGQFPELIREFLMERKALSRPVVPGDVDERLDHLFDDTVRRMPDAIAASEGGVNFSYAEVKAKADVLAAGLDAVLPDRERPVALQMPSCAEASILVLAILKSGRAFQPIDPSEPEARRNAALVRTGACALMLPSGISPGILPEGVRPFDSGKIKTMARDSKGFQAPSRTAYLVYTSGSTGEPKAVEVEHSAVINHARAMIRIFGLAPRDRVLQFHTLAFDAAFEEIFPSWIAGACVVFDPQARNLSTPGFLEMIKWSDVTVLNLPTSYWHTLTQEAVRLALSIPSKVRLLVVGGEQASTKVYSAWRALAATCRWINTYGPTEATITALAYEPPASASIRGVIPVGRPIDGITTLLLNGSGEPIPVGEGELLIGGKGLALGYREDAATTAAKFVTHIINGVSQRFYRTGDRVRLRHDGNFEFLGRLDRQIKIRGHRVDPDEIERALRLHPSVIDAVAMPKTVKGELILAGWVTRADASLTERQLRTHLVNHLPIHMIPTQLTFSARMPRKPSGKIDRAALVPVRQPRGNLDDGGALEMTALFSELLGHKVGLQDDFFLSGGHSLLAIKLLGRIEARFGARIALTDFVSAPTAKNVWLRVQATPTAKATIAQETLPAEIPVSAQQNRTLLAHEVGHPSLANIALLFRVDGRLDENVLARAVETVIRKNFLLRARFFKTDTGIVLREATALPKLECRTITAKNFENAVVNLTRLEGSKPFPLGGQTPWIRLILVSEPRSRNRHLVLITHHAIADGWALEILLDDLCNCYDFVRKGGSGLLKPLGDYRVYALEQARWLSSDAAREQISFWKKKLSGAEEARLPFRRPAPPDTLWQIERHELALSPQLSRDLRQVSRSYGTTPFALAMACFKALTHRYAGQSDITLGTVVSNRSTHVDQGIFGPLQNPALIRDEVTSGLSLRRLSQAIARSLTAAQVNGALPFEQVLREALPKSLATRVGSIQFLSHDRAKSAMRLGPASLSPIEIIPEKNPFELSVAVSAAASHAKIVFEYQPTAYAAEDIKCLGRQYAAALQSIVDHPEATVAELNLIPAVDLDALQRRVSKRHHPQAELLHEGFESQVRRNPGAAAVIARDRSLTYGELNSLAEETAQVLMQGGLKKTGLVAVMLPKGWEQIVACLAILKAGGVYVPLDPSLPLARLEAIFKQGGFQAAIVADEGRRDAAWARGLSSVITIHSQLQGRLKSQRLRTKPDSLAYIIFTSGSTGVPKGVMISHQAATTTIAEINRRFRVQQSDRVFAVSALGFDLSVFDIFGTLRAGGAIVMPGRQDPKEWLEQVVADKVTIWNSVPCLFALLLDESVLSGASLKALQLILLSGDFISLALARRTRTALPGTRLVSLGGATEAAIWSIAHEVEAIDCSWHRVPYGHALRRQEVFVLDGELNHCPAGVNGELFIAGAGLAQGYWRNRSETRRRFLRHPRWNIRLYQTGDQGRYRENGEIEILGRLDEQVKVNGVRLEPGEVETALLTIQGVRQTLTEVRVDASGNKQLVCFIAAEPGTNSAVLFAHAKKILPAALRPSAYVVMDRFPLTANGKVDRAALRAMNLPVPKNTKALPENPTEAWIVNLWSTLLGEITVGVEDDFFAVGGHSLLAIKMLQRVRTHYAVDLPLSLIVERPTVRGLAAAISSASALKVKTGLTQRATAELEHASEPIMSKPIRQANQKADAVLLSGVTGHLGAALLKELLETTGARIYCLVRSTSGTEAERRLDKIIPPDKTGTTLRERLVAIPGDLSRERFGLEPSAFDDLAKSVRTIYHCAAEVNFIAPYERLAPTNVGGVREMIRLATRADALLHHVSSVAVFPYGGTQTRREDEDITKVQWLAGGYAQTKWVSERMIWKAIALGLRAVIYRPAQIVGRNGNSPRDLFDHLLQTCKTLQAVPDIEADLDMVTPAYAAASIVALSTQEKSLGKAFHVVHPEPVSVRNFVGLFPKPLPLVPVDTWLRRLKREAQLRDDSSLHFVSLLAQGLDRSALIPPRIDCSGTTLGLLGSGIVCPPLDRKFIQRELVAPEEGKGR